MVRKSRLRLPDRSLNGVVVVHRAPARRVAGTLGMASILSHVTVQFKRER